MAQTHNIEDVLSSIRRLVANEAPVAGRRAPEVPILVLAEAQRVTEPEDPFQMIRALAQEERDGRDAIEFTDAMSGDVNDGAHVAEVTEEATRKEKPRVDAEAVAVAEPTPDAGDGAGSGVEAETEAGGTSDLWEDFSDVASALPGDYAEDDDFEAAEEHHLAVGFVAPQPVVAAPGPPSKAGEPTAFVTLSDLSGAGADDEPLRDLIAEIVRQELAGELGERITRNVRKLVRREIRQLLATRTFD